MQFLRNFLRQTVQFKDYMNKEQSYWQYFCGKIRSCFRSWVFNCI